MREQAKVPRWALEHIRGRLRPGEEVINAVALKQGPVTAFVLLNTSKGAAVVTKGLVGEPRSVLLTYPKDLLTFRCAGCSGRNVLVDVAPPADIHCTHCAAEHHVEEEGHVRPGRAAASMTSGKEAAKSAGQKGTTSGKKAARSTAKKGTTSGKKAAKSAGKKGTTSGKKAARPAAKKGTISGKTAAKSAPQKGKTAGKKAAKPAAKRPSKSSAKRQPGPKRTKSSRSS